MKVGVETPSLALSLQLLLNNDLYMKQRISYLLTFAFALFLSGNAFAQKTFEGTMTMEIASHQKDNAKMTMTTSVKGEKSVMELQMAQGNMKMFIDQAAGKMTMVMEALKMGMVTDLKKAEEAAKKLPQDLEPPTITATGEKKNINGHECERYQVITHTGDSSNWWMTKDVPERMLKSLRATLEKGMKNAVRSRAGGIGSSMEALFKKGMMPIQIESKQATITFVKFEEKQIDDSVFVIPSDITIQEMPAGLGGGM